jgi:hypothetical protein
MKLTLSMGAGEHFQLCLRAGEHGIIPVADLDMSGADIPQVQSALNTLNVFIEKQDQDVQEQS